VNLVQYLHILGLKAQRNVLPVPPARPASHMYPVSKSRAPDLPQRKNDNPNIFDFFSGTKRVFFWTLFTSPYRSARVGVQVQQEAADTLDQADNVLCVKNTYFKKKKGLFLFVYQVTPQEDSFRSREKILQFLVIGPEHLWVNSAVFNNTCAFVWPMKSKNQNQSCVIWPLLGTSSEPMANPTTLFPYRATILAGRTTNR